MGYDGTGQFTRLYSWQAEEAANVGIVSDHHDQEDDNFAQGLNLAFCRDGQSAATGHWDLANHRIGNLAGGTNDGDAVNLAQLTGSGALPTPDIRKSLNLIGADANGRINFMSATGVNGIGWFGADLCWVARLDEADKTRDRLVMNNLWNGGLTATPGTDVIVLDDAGNIGCTSLTYNLSLDTDGDWRTISPGWGARLVWQADGKLAYQQNKTATATDPYVAAPLEDRMVIDGKDGHVTLWLNKTETGDKYARIIGAKNSEMRWEMQLGTAHAESGTRVGSHFYLTSYDNAGANPQTPFYILRDTGKVGMTYGITGPLLLDNYIGTTALGIFGGVGGIYLRPNGYLNSTGQMSIDTAGHMHIEGIYERSGTGGSYGSQVYNSLYAASNDQRWYIGDSLVGYYTPACDYRIKRDIRPLPSSWEAVKKLRPVVFKPAAFGGPDSAFKDEDDDRVGFLAHELQDALGKHAATGEKDGMEDAFEDAEDGTRKPVGKRPSIQGPDVMAVVASLCSALQEAQLRIEALEAKLAA